MTRRRRSRLKLPQGLRSKNPELFKLVDTSERSDEEFDEDNLVLVEDGLRTVQPTSCLYGMFSYVWNWRARSKAKKIAKSRVDIEANIENMQTKINEYSTRDTELEVQLRKAVNLKDRTLAKQLLLKRKRTQGMITQYTNFKNELDNMLMSLDETEDRQSLVKSFKTTHKALKRTMGGSAVTAIETLDDLHDDMDDVRTSNMELQDAMTNRELVGDDDLADELDELFAEEKPKSKKRVTFEVRDAPDDPPDTDSMILAKLPPPPTATPVSMPEVPEDDVILMSQTPDAALEAALL